MIVATIAKRRGRYGDVEVIGPGHRPHLAVVRWADGVKTREGVDLLLDERVTDDEDGDEADG